MYISHPCELTPTQDGLSVLNYPSVIQNTDLLKTLLYHVSQDGIPVNTGHDVSFQSESLIALFGFQLFL